ncbi:ATP-binding protein [Achromobacter xylosoxidans]|uniref:ATP-binding protein n=1 Tax=Alcaligenes xylosoxydans xylosoxydans TaxID=85698 RepID=UPI001F1447C1|nr:ATP-binding protein [Achromobacter xylosoxidans]
MLKFILRLFVVAVISLTAAFQVVDKGLVTLFSPRLDDLAERSIRGQVHALQKELDPVAPQAREAFLREELLPHYGADLRLLPWEAVRPDERERQQMEQAGFIMRDEYNTYLIPLPGAPRQWLELRLPGDGMLDKLMTWGAWTMLTLIMATAFLLLWALPVWRDLDTLRNAALGMGQGDLGRRVRLSRVSGIRHVGESFNHMAERISALIDNQRSLTNAVSHELRTPLARLSFEIDIVDRGKLRSRHRQTFQDMRADIAELESMVGELLIYARLERPNEEATQLDTVDARDWLGEALAQIAHQAEARQVRCSVRDGHPPHVSLHPRNMTRALSNLVQNAVRYARERVEVALLPTCDGGFELIVDDDGPGIPPTDRERVFEPFIRLDESRDRGTGGAGLGLAIVQRVAASHGGSIRVCDSPLGGARFVLRWPDTAGAGDTVRTLACHA